MENNFAIWAVDPFAEDKHLQFEAVQALSKLLENTGIKIEPVCVLSPDQLRVPRSAFSASTKEYHLEAEENLIQWSKELNIPNLVAARLLIQEEFSSRASIRTLLDYARNTNAEIIAMSTKGRAGVKHLLLGSFAENLLMHTDIPLLVVSPHSIVPSKIRNIFFPTDFSVESRFAFEKLISIAKLRQAKIVLYYKLEYILPETVDAINSIPNYHQYVEEDVKTRKNIAQEWIALGQSSQVEVDFVFDETPGFVAEAILHALASYETNLIAMASHSGPLASAFLGSITRQIIRAAPCPIWVIHPDRETIEKHIEIGKWSRKLRQDLNQ